MAERSGGCIGLSQHLVDPQEVYTAISDLAHGRIDDRLGCLVVRAGVGA